MAQPLGAILIFLVLWELICRGFGVPAYLVPAPTAIWTDTWQIHEPIRKLYVLF